MNILLAGSSSGLMDQMIRKFKKEGHRVCVLTGRRYKEDMSERVFETYRFPYDSESVQAVFESVLPDVTVFLGAYDLNFRWDDGQKTSVSFVTALANLLTSFDQSGRGRFIYLSSDEVYGGDHPENIVEDTAVDPETPKGMALAQGENLCAFFGKSCKKDVVTLRLQHLYMIPEKRTQCNETLTWLCLEALKGNELRVDENRKFALLFASDAVEFIYKTAVCSYHASGLYHLSSSVETNEAELARKICAAMRDDAQEGKETPGPSVSAYKSAPGVRCVLSNERFVSEFDAVFFGDTDKNIQKIAERMKSSPSDFLTDAERKPTFWERLVQRAGWFLKAAIPFVENLVCFIPFAILNRYAAGSAYFSRLDVYLLYVLLFAIVHGQQQAIVSSILATIGFFFQQSASRSGFDVAVDYNTYVWIAQLFIVGLLVGYLHDHIRYLKDVAADEQEYLSGQLSDIRSINESNVRVKDALTTQIINQNDSIGKIYRMTSALDRLTPEDVLFRAASMLGELMDSKDVAIYTVSDSAYARLFSATSRKARQGGNSIRYLDQGKMSEALKDHKVFINRELDERYPMMASAIWNNDKVEVLIMIWSLPWDHMTLGQADYLVVCGYLIQNAVLHANRYLSFLRSDRYVEGLELLNESSFQSLAHSFLLAKRDGLTECTLLEVDTAGKTLAEAGKELRGSLRSSDYAGASAQEKLYILLSNTSREEAGVVMERIENKGYQCRIKEERAA